MAALRQFGGSVNAWADYAVGLGGIATLLVPRAARWGRAWVRARADQRLVLGRAVGATTQVS